MIILAQQFLFFSHKKAMANRLEQTAEKYLCNQGYLIEIADASVAGSWQQV